MRNAITVFEVLAVLAVLFVSAAVATRDTEILKDAPPDDPDVELPIGPLQPEDIGAVRFGMVARGYRMREVDDVLTRLAAELVARDERIMALEQALVDVVEPQLEAAEQGLITPAAASPEVLADPPVFADVPLPVTEEPPPAPAPELSEPQPALAGPGPDSSPGDREAGPVPAAEPVLVQPVLEEPVIAPPEVETAAPIEPVAVEERTAEVEPAPVPEPAPVDLPFEEPPQELPHWPQPALEPEPEPLIPEPLGPEDAAEPVADLTSAVDDAAFSSPQDAFPEVKSADEDE